MIANENDKVGPVHISNDLKPAQLTVIVIVIHADRLVGWGDGISQERVYTHGRVN